MTDLLEMKVTSPTGHDTPIKRFKEFMMYGTAQFMQRAATEILISMDKNNRNVYYPLCLLCILHLHGVVVLVGLVGLIGRHLQQKTVNTTILTKRKKLIFCKRIKWIGVSQRRLT